MLAYWKKDPVPGPWLLSVLAFTTRQMDQIAGQVNLASESQKIISLVAILLVLAIAGVLGLVLRLHS